MQNPSHQSPQPSESDKPQDSSGSDGSQSQQDPYIETVTSPEGVDLPAKKSHPTGNPGELQEASYLWEVNSKTPPPAEKLVRLGRYEVHKMLGQGGFGTVFLGYDSQLDRQVAIKVPRLGTVSGDVQKEFFAEARQVAKLHHPGIVSVYDVGIDGNQCFIVSRYLDGPNLYQYSKDKKIDWQEAVRIVASLADALAHAHTQRVVHRDLKPSNVIMTDDETPVIVDFGLALSDVKSTSHERGLITGTPSYMSPEQALGEGHRIDGRADIYALGVILYRLLTGRNPFQANQIQELLRQVVEDEPQPPRQLVPKLPRDLERICLKAMAKQLRRRYVTAGDMVEELLQLIGRRSSSDAVPAQRDTTGIDENESPPAPPVTAVSSSSAQQVHTKQEESALTPVSTSDSIGRSTSRRSQEALRRRVTLVLCACDVFTSQEVIESLDIEEQQEVLLEFRKLCQSESESSGGTIFQETTNGVLLCFGFPVAFEDASLRAVRCATRVVNQLEELNRSLRKKYDTQISAVAAVHSDHAIVQDKGVDAGGLSIIGQVLNVVNQLDAESAPNTVTVTDDIRRLLAAHFEWESLGPQQLRGIGAKTLYRVIGERSPNRLTDETSEIQTPLIGRDLEFGLLQQRWEQSAEGMGQVVLLIGEAGLGKSRLVQTLKDHVRHTGGGSDSIELSRSLQKHEPVIVEWRSSPQFANSSLYPVIDYFERCCGFERSDDGAAKLDKLVHHLAALNFDGDEQIALFAGLLSIPLGGRYPALTLDPQRQKERTFQAQMEWLRELSYENPVLFIIEDLHWVDPTTLEFVKEFVSQGFNDSILTLLTFRPEFVTPWQSMAHQTQIALNRLTRNQIAEMVTLKAGAENISRHVIEQIIDRTDGVPLFIEEFTQMIIESAAMMDPETSASSSGSVRSREIPATLHDLLMARLDRIDANLEVVQLGAAIGREFTHELISTASPLPESELELELDKLVAAEVLYARGRSPRRKYQFKHALIQDAAYGSLVKKTRRAIHHRIGEALETDFPEIAENQPELLAMHCTEAGETSKAINYWERAGVRSLERRAHKEAIQQLQQGLQLIVDEPDSSERIRQELRMQTALGVPLQATIGYSAPEVEQAYTRAHELSMQVGLSTEQFPVLYGMFRYYMLAAKYPKARELGSQLLVIAEETHIPHYVVAANRARGGPPVYEGQLVEAVPFLKRVIDINPSPELRSEVYRYDVVDPWIASRSYLSWATWLMGFPEQSLAHSNEAVKIAEGLDHSFSVTLAVSFSQWVHQFRLDVSKTRATAEKALAIAKEQGFAFWYGWCGVMRGWAVAQQGQAKEAVSEIRQGIADWRAQGSELGCHYYYALLADACMKAGQLDDAKTALDEAKNFAQETGEGFYLAEIHRLRGRLLLAGGSASEPAAEASFREALEVAQYQKAKSLELRAARNLARFLQKRGDAAAARELLDPIVRWFSEGFETHDFKRSAELLESL